MTNEFIFDCLKSHSHIQNMTQVHIWCNIMKKQTPASCVIILQLHSEKGNAQS